MKKLVFSCAVLIAGFGAMMTVGCKKKSNSSPPANPTISCTTCVTAAEAKAENDNSSKGTYKGVIVGSSGTIKFDIGNSDSTIRAFMVIDGVKDTLAATIKWVSGVSYVSSFTGTFNGQPASINFSVDANGGNPTVTSMNIPGHPSATLTMSKETSDNLIECFEGSIVDITTGETGTFDMMLSTKLKKWSAQVRTTGQTSSSSVSGVIDGTKLSFDDGKGSTGNATLSGDKIIDGTWVNNKPEHGTWIATRTL